MNLIIQLVIGGVVGWLASMVMKTNAQMGAVANVIVGIIGSVLGGWIGTQLGATGGTALTWIMSVVGASVLIFLLKIVGVFK